MNKIKIFYSNVIRTFYHYLFSNSDYLYYTNKIKAYDI